MPSFKPARTPGKGRRGFVVTRYGETGEGDGNTVDGFLPESASGQGASAKGLPATRLELEEVLGCAREEGRAEGRAEGLEEGRAAGRAEAETEALASAREALEEVAIGLAAVRRGYLKSERRALVDVAVAIAEQVAARAIEVDPDALAGVVERALGVLEEPRNAEVRLSPPDLELIERGAMPTLEAAVAAAGITLTSDDSLAQGDVRILAGTTEVDARRVELLRRVREELLDLIEVEEAGL